MKPMPATQERPNDDSNRFIPQFGAIIENIKRRGSESLTDTERVMVVQIFRMAAIIQRKDLIEAKHAIQQAHLEYCWRMTK